MSEADPADPADAADLKRLGRIIRLYRKRLGLSQAALARSAGMHRNYVGSLERGEINPTYRTLVRLSGALRVSLVRLIAVAQRTASNGG